VCFVCVSSIINLIYLKQLVQLLHNKHFSLYKLKLFIIFFQPFLRINKSQDVRNFCLPQLPDPQDPQGDPGLPGVNAKKLFAHEAPKVPTS
jgi:hypothetical protein